MNKYYLLVVLLLVSLTLVGVASNYPTGAWIGYNADTGKFIPVAVDASGTVLVEGIGGASESAIKAQVDTINEESGGSTLTDSLDLVDSNYTNIKAALASTGVDMTGVKPSGYDAKVTEAVYTTAFSFDVANKSIAHYDHASFGTRPIIPASIRGYTVEHIGLTRDGASWPGFRNMPLVNVTFPNQPLTIELTTFYNCGLKTLSLPDDCVVQNVAFGSNPIAFTKLGNNVGIYDNSSISSYGTLKTLYDGLGKVTGYYAYANSAWAPVASTTENFSVENGNFSRSELLEILALLPVVVNKTITVTNCIGAPDLTTVDIADFAAKGWVITP